KGGRIEEDRDERAGTEAGSGAFTGFEGGVEFGAGGGADGGELSAGGEGMGVSYRQAKRLWKRYRAQGAKGLVHGNAGRASNRAKPEKLRRRVLSLLRKKYGGEEGERFGPTLAAEHLAEEDGIELGVETLRGWMLEEGLWSRNRRRLAPRH